MKTFLYIVGFITVAFTAAPIMSAGDPERLGAEASLLLFGSVVAVFSCIAFALSVRRHALPFAKSLSLVLGAVCSSFFYLGLGFLFPAVHLLLAVGLASLLAVALSVALPFAVRRAWVQPTLQADSPASGGPAA